MSLFKKLFNLSQKPSHDPKEEVKDERSKYMPEGMNLPVDERFIHNFTKQGGRFLYCVNQDEVDQNFEGILKEHNWYHKKVYCPINELKDRFSGFKMDLDSKNEDASILLSTCEFIIADSGALLFSSNQVKQFKTHELPDVYIIFASASQIVESIGEGLRGIKVKSQNMIPTNITTVKHYKDQEGDDNKDLMHYGAAHKMVYLLLLEDL